MNDIYIICFTEIQEAPILPRMTHTDLIERVLEAHEVSLVITGPWGEATHVNVAMPDLRCAPRQVWGDWGPMYTVSLPPDRTIEVSVRTPTDPEITREALDIGKLEIDSPMSAATRRRTPLVVKLPLARRGLGLHVHYDTQGRPAKAEILPIGGPVRPHTPYDVAMEDARCA